MLLLHASTHPLEIRTFSELIHRRPLDRGGAMREIPDCPLTAARIRPDCHRDPVLANREGDYRLPEGPRVSSKSGFAEDSATLTWPTARESNHSLSEHPDRMPYGAALGTASRTVARPLVVVIIAMDIFARPTAWHRPQGAFRGALS